MIDYAFLYKMTDYPIIITWFFIFFFVYGYVLLRVPASGAVIAGLEIFRISVPAAAFFAIEGNIALSVCILLCCASWPIGVLIGYRAFQHSAFPRLSVNLSLFDQNIRAHNIVFLFLLIGVFSVYHYSVIGLPLLAESALDKARFDISSSGLFGIPSRFASFGPSFLLIALLLYFKPIFKNFRWIFHFLFIVSFIAVIALFLAKGHKSAVLSVVLIFIVLHRFMTFRSIRLKVRHVFIIATGIIVASAVGASRYTDLTVFEYMVGRIVFSGPDALIAAVSTFDGLYSFGSAIYGDLRYLPSIFFGEKFELFVIELSRHIYNVPFGNFTVPVTPSIVGLAIYDFGYVFGPAFCFAVSFTLGGLMKNSDKAISSTSLFLLVSFEFVLYQGAARGQLFYVMQNSIPVILVMYWLLKIRLTKV